VECEVQKFMQFPHYLYDTKAGITERLNRLLLRHLLLASRLAFSPRWKTMMKKSRIVSPFQCYLEKTDVTHFPFTFFVLVQFST